MRHRREDIPTLARHFLKKFEPVVGRSVVEITPNAEVALKGYRWPGNVRQLEGAIQQALVLGSSPTLDVGDLPRFVFDAVEAPQTDFIAALNAAVIELQRAMQAKSSSKGAHSGSIASFNETLRQATVDLKRLDALVKNSLGNDPAIMAAWRIARRVSHSGTTAKVAPAEPSPAAAGAAAGKSV